MAVVSYYSKAKYFFLGSLSILIGVASFFISSLPDVRRSPGEGASSSPIVLFLIFFVLGVVILAYGYFVRRPEREKF